MTINRSGMEIGNRSGVNGDIKSADTERLLNEANSRSRVNWPGVFVGLVAGITVLITLGTLGVAIGASAADSLGGLGIGAVIWTALTVLISAYLAGYTAVRGGNQGLASRGQFTGLVTGMLLTLALTLVLSNVVSGLVGTASSVLGSVATGAANVASAASSNPGTQNAVQSIVSGLNPDTIGQIISDASPTLSQQQASAAATVVTGVITRASNDIGSNLGNITNLSDLVTNRVKSIQQALSGPQFVTRLTRQGLSQAQAQTTQTAIVAQAQQIQQQATATAAAAARIARQAAISAAWGSLLAAGLVIGFSTLGGNQAASTRRKIDSNTAA